MEIPLPAEILYNAYLDTLKYLTNALQALGLSGQEATGFSFFQLLPRGRSGS